MNPALLIIAALGLWMASNCGAASADASPYAARQPASAGLPPGTDPVEEGRALAEKLRNASPPESTAYNGLLRIKSADRRFRTVLVTSTVHVNPASWQAIYETALGTNRAERLTIVHEAGKSNVYLYAFGNELDKPKRMTGDQAVLPFAGSDFWLLDLGLEFYHWPNQRLVKFDMTRSRSVRVLESVNPSPAPNSYSRVVSWVDVETDGLIRAEAYDVRNKRLKEFNVGSFRKVEDQWQLQDMEIRNVQANTATKLEFDLNAK